MSTPYTQLQKILASDGQPNDQFGNAVALSTHGHVALIGGPYRNGISDNTGSAYVFRFSGSEWMQEQELFASDGEAADFFGSAIAISHDGKTILVGAPDDEIGGNTEQGSAYVFVHSDSGSPWVLQKKLVYSSATSDQKFGTAVALSADGNRALVGAPDGKIIVFFQRSGITWTEEQVDGPGIQGYGSSVAVSSGTTDQLKWAVGNPQESSGGVIHIFQRSDNVWVQTLHSPLLLQSPDIIANDELGFSVAISHDGKTIIGGAPSKNSNQGAAYAFTLSDTVWSQQYKFLPSDVMAGDQFGFSVALGQSPEGHDMALIGAQGGNKSYIFKRISDVWTQFQTIRVNDSDVSVNFGNAVALAGHGLHGLIGASEFSSNRGSAYFFGTDPSFTPTTDSKTSFISFLPEVLIGVIAVYTGIVSMFLHNAKGE